MLRALQTLNREVLEKVLSLLRKASSVTGVFVIWL